MLQIWRKQLLKVYSILVKSNQNPCFMLLEKTLLENFECTSAWIHPLTGRGWWCHAMEMFFLRCNREAIESSQKDGWSKVHCIMRRKPVRSYDRTSALNIQNCNWFTSRQINMLKYMQLDNNTFIFFHFRFVH